MDSGKVLLVRHLKGGNHLDDTYGLPAGRLEIGEEYIQAAIRELKEETGLTGSTEDMIALPTEYHALIKRKNGEEVAMSMKMFLCLKWTGVLTDSDETEPVWVDFAGIDSLELLPNVQNAIEEAIHFNR